MAGLNFLTILRKAQKTGKIPGKPETRDWFRDQARRTVHVNVDKLLKDPNASSTMEPGKLYMFSYDPKWKDKLPYYDAFPLVFPFKVKGDRIWCINLHYLDPTLRAALMDELMKLTDGRTKNENKKLRISYEILNGASRFSLFKPCVKSYLAGHFRSRFLQIPYDQWDIALMLPTARFQKASQSKVWADSRDWVEEDNS